MSAEPLLPLRATWVLTLHSRALKGKQWMGRRPKRVRNTRQRHKTQESGVAQRKRVHKHLCTHTHTHTPATQPITPQQMPRKDGKKTHRRTLPSSKASLMSEMSSSDVPFRLVPGGITEPAEIRRRRSRVVAEYQRKAPQQRPGKWIH